jgi:uncharacterized membrane protein YhaH (DUF805 family)
MKWFFIVLRKYAVFTGRARRKEFWMFTLFFVLFSLGFALVDKVLGTTFGLEKGIWSDELISLFTGWGWFESVFSLALFVPSLAVTFRRLHDIGKSGWWILLFFIPIIGWIILLVWHCTDSDEGENKYGPNPKEIVE